MPYHFSTNQIEELENLFNSGPEKNQAGDFAAFYQRMSQMLSTEDVNGNAPDDDPGKIGR